MLTSCLMTSDFASWLQAELDERQISPAELARLTRKDEGIFSRILGRKRSAKPETLNAIAKALRIPPEQVFRAAGLLPTSPDEDETMSEISHIYHELNSTYRDDLLDYARLRLQKQEKEKAGKRARVP